VTVFSGLASEPVATVFSGLTSKSMTTVSPGLTSKSVTGFLVEPQNQGRQFISGLITKPLGRFFINLCLKTDGEGL
jgi:hypothetical protein